MEGAVALDLAGSRPRYWAVMEFDHQPILKGALVELRPLRADDYDALYDVASDHGIWEEPGAAARSVRVPLRRFRGPVHRPAERALPARGGEDRRGAGRNQA